MQPSSNGTKALPERTVTELPDTLLMLLVGLQAPTVAHVNAKLTASPDGPRVTQAPAPVFSNSNPTGTVVFSIVVAVILLGAAIVFMRRPNRTDDSGTMKEPT